VNARGIVTNFQQADTNEDGKVSQAEFLEACKLGVVTGGAVDVNTVAEELYYELLGTPCVRRPRTTAPFPRLIGAVLASISHRCCQELTRRLGAQEHACIARMKGDSNGSLYHRPSARAQLDLGGNVDSTARSL
jgi:hypothetical protein